jgi:retron-type reverse transcriptase
MYPLTFTLDFTKTHLTIHNDPQTINQITNLLSTILAQNYFLFQSKIYKSDKGVARGSPISGTMAEIFLQHLENTRVKHLVDTNHILFYARYLDDIYLSTTPHLPPPTSLHITATPPTAA